MNSIQRSLERDEEQCDEGQVIRKDETVVITVIGSEKEIVISKNSIEILSGESRHARNVHVEHIQSPQRRKPRQVKKKTIIRKKVAL